jgi:MYXO-CTERM domain-containing protein
VNGECAVVEAAQCKADSTTVLINPDGSETDCAPFRCASAACITRCESIDDCAEGSVCDADGGCVAPPEDPPPVEDCSVGERGRSPRGFAGALALLALAAFTTRRGPGARTQRGVR